MNVTIESSWKQILAGEFEKPYFKALVEEVKNEYSTKTVYPQPQEIFRAFDLVPFQNVRVLILGQDPYHTPGVADGLAFSTKPGNKVPPSLQNMYKEIIQEFEYTLYPFVDNPDLTRWATQGVLLLNNTLTVRKGEANSHATIGWNIFTDSVLSIIAQQKKHVVFMLWGKFAQSKYDLIEPFVESNTHLVLQSPHPSPFSARRGFFGNNHFKQANEFLLLHGLESIEW